jgi:hypothetical protein
VVLKDKRRMVFIFWSLMDEILAGPTNPSNALFAFSSAPNHQPVWGPSSGSTKAPDGIAFAVVLEVRVTYSTALAVTVRTKEARSEPQIL